MPRKQAPQVRFSQELFDTICARIAAGGPESSLRAICAEEGMPDRGSFLRWAKQTDELAEQYDRACLDREESFFDEIIEIADACRVGEKKVTKANGDIEVTEVDMVERARVQIDARKWCLARMNRKKYGDRVLNEHTGEDGGPVLHRIELEIVDPQDSGSSQA